MVALMVVQDETKH